jgi:hypothetical protein|nr:hypothetical protein [Actinacidiphila oryziradicis]
MQDRPDLQECRRTGAPVTAQFDLRLTPLLVHDREAGEDITTAFDLNGHPRLPICVGHSGYRLGERDRVADIGEQVHVVGQPLQEPVCLNGVATSKDESIVSS